MYEFYYNILQPYWKQSIQLHYMDTDSFILSFDTNHQELINFLQENKDEFNKINFMNRFIHSIFIFQ